MIVGVAVVEGQQVKPEATPEDQTLKETAGPSNKAAF